MEEVWVVYLCMILFVFVIILMKQKPADEVRRESTDQGQSAPTTSLSGALGKRLECTEEELEKSLHRLTGILFGGDARKREPHAEHQAAQHHSRTQEKA